MCVAFFNVFVLSRFWSLDHRVKFFSFIFTFFLTFLHFQFFFSFLLLSFEPFVLLSCFSTSLCCLEALLCCLKWLFRHLIVPYVALSCCLKWLLHHLIVPCGALSCCLIALSYYINLLPLCLVVPHVAQTASLPWVTSHCFTTFLPRATLLLGCHHTPSTSWPPHLLFHCLIALCLATSSPCYLAPLCSLVFFSSLLFCREELGAWRNKVSRRLVFFWVNT